MVHKHSEYFGEGVIYVSLFTFYCYLCSCEPKYKSLQSGGGVWSVCDGIGFVKTWFRVCQHLTPGAGRLLHVYQNVTSGTSIIDSRSQSGLWNYDLAFVKMWLRAHQHVTSEANLLCHMWLQAATQLTQICLLHQNVATPETPLCRNVRI